MINETILLPYLSNYWRREVWCGNVKYLLFHLVAESNQLYVRTPQTTSIEKITIQFQKKLPSLDSSSNLRAKRIVSTRGSDRRRQPCY